MALWPVTRVEPIRGSHRACSCQLEAVHHAVVIAQEAGVIVVCRRAGPCMLRPLSSLSVLPRCDIEVVAPLQDGRAPCLGRRATTGQEETTGHMEVVTRE